MLKTRLILIFAPLLISLGTQAAKDNGNAVADWYEFQSQEGKFSIQFPVKPEIKTTHRISVIGDVTNHIFVANQGYLNLGVDYSDLPAFALAFTGKETVYKHSIGALLKKTLGKVRSNEDFEYRGHQGKHIIYDIAPVPGKPVMYGEAYLFLVDHRLYVIDANAPAETAVSDVQHFLNSFRLE